jgi:hypothetical protein
LTKPDCGSRSPGIAVEMWLNVQPQRRVATKLEEAGLRAVNALLGSPKYAVMAYLGNSKEHIRLNVAKAF